jgi:sugar lactone lactonase YvrE
MRIFAGFHYNTIAVVRFAAVAFLLIAESASQGLPASDVHSREDWRAIRTEVGRQEKLLHTASDKCTVMYAIARTWGYAGQYPEVMRWLKRAVDPDVGLDPSRDSLFQKLRDVPAFQALLQRVVAGTPSVSTSSAAFQIAEGDLLPENLAYDPARARFYLGSVYKNKVVQCDSAGACSVFVGSNQNGLGSVLGLKVDPRGGTLWVTSNGEQQSGLFHYDLEAGRLRRKHVLEGQHLFNDLAIDLNGNVFVTDTRAGAVYWIASGSDKLERYTTAAFPSANGIAVAPDGKQVYVAEFGDGISVIDTASRKSRPLGHPKDLCLGTIDGLYFYRDSLIAIQNGIMNPRVARFYLDSHRRTITGFDVLERRNPLFDSITTGVIAGDDFFYIANTQLDQIRDGKVAADAVFKPIAILRIALKY